METNEFQRFLISLTLCAIFIVTSAQNTALNNHNNAAGYGGLNNVGLGSGLGLGNGMGLDGLGLSLPNLGLQNNPQTVNQGLGYGLGGFGLGGLGLSGLSGVNNGNYANNGAKIGATMTGNTNSAGGAPLQALGLNGLGPMAQSAYGGMSPFGYNNAFNPGYGGYGGYPAAGMGYGMPAAMGNGMMNAFAGNGYGQGLNPMSGYGAGYGNAFVPGLMGQQGYNNQMYDQFDD